MNLDEDIYLTFSKDVDVTKLTYKQMMYYMKHNIFQYIKVIYAVQSQKYYKLNKGNKVKKNKGQT